MSWSVVAAFLVFLPRPSATLAATTLRDQAMASSNVSQPMPWRFALSTFVRPLSSRSVPTSLIRVPGVTVPFSSAAAAVIILNTEPGS